MGLGSLFSSSSKSKSSSSTTNTSTSTDNSQQTSGTIGDLSKGNLIAGQNATMYGYTADDTATLIDDTLDKAQGLIKTGFTTSQNYLDTALEYIDRANADLKDINSKAIQQVQSAYSGANNSILESQNQTKAFLNSFKPYAFYAMIAAIAYFAFTKGGKK